MDPRSNLGCTTTGASVKAYNVFGPPCEGMQRPPDVDMSNRDIEVFNDSLARCLKRGQLFERFLELFLASSDEVRKKFQFTDLGRQRRALQNAFYMLVEHLAMHSPESEAYLERIAVRARPGRS